MFSDAVSRRRTYPYPCLVQYLLRDRQHSSHGQSDNDPRFGSQRWDHGTRTTEKECDALQRRGIFLKSPLALALYPTYLLICSLRVCFVHTISRHPLVARHVTPRRIIVTRNIAPTYERYPRFAPLTPHRPLIRLVWRKPDVLRPGL